MVLFDLNLYLFNKMNRKKICYDYFDKQKIVRNVMKIIVSRMNIGNVKNELIKYKFQIFDLFKCLCENC